MAGISDPLRPSSRPIRGSSPFPEGRPRTPWRLPPALLTLALLALALPVAAAERLPDGEVASAPGRGVVAAWYADPTERYRHAVLGDGIEGGSLVVRDDQGREHRLVLPLHQVFEDVTPGIVDLDQDGVNEVVTIRSDLGGGAAVAVYGVGPGGLREVAATAPIGIPNRWLSVAAIADFLGEGRPAIAVVRMPHLAGELVLLSLNDGQLQMRRGPLAGFSSHMIGSRLVSTATAADADGDGAPDLVLTDRSYREVVVVRFRSGLEVIRRHPLPARLTGQLLVADGALIARLENGAMLRLPWPSEGRSAR